MGGAAVNRDFDDAVETGMKVIGFVAALPLLLLVALCVGAAWVIGRSVWLLQAVRP